MIFQVSCTKKPHAARRYCGLTVSPMRGAIVGAQQETGEVVADTRTAGKSLSVQRLGRFVAAEAVGRAQADVADIGERIDLPFAAGLVCVVAMHPGYLRHASRPDLQIETAIAGADRGGQAAVGIAAQASAAEAREAGPGAPRLPSCLLS